jgi:Flp pilus assembly secretin CpaC
MNHPPTLDFWLHTLGVLAFQSAVVLGVAGLVQGLVRVARWRRAVWQAALIGLALLLANTLAGLDRHVAAWFASQPKSVPQFIVRANLPVESGATLPGLEAAELVSRTPDAALLAGHPAAPTGVWWPAWLWLGGAVVIGLWTLMPRFWLVIAARRADFSLPSEARERLDALAGRLNLRRPVHVLVSARLAGPIAFGVLRPGIGLPADFWAAHSRVEQDAMLAHELAHHAARDPLWLALADLLLAALWWHPLVWWARRQFRAASESAADEASLVVEDGPAVLAGCLVALATRLQRSGVLGLLGMAGFRSDLGRRVERLLRLRAGERLAEERRWFGAFVASVGLASVGIAVAASAWLIPAQAASRLALLAVFGEALTQAYTPATQSAAADDPTKLIPARATADGSAASDQAAGELPRAALMVQLPQVPGLEPRRVREISMDAITRRLEWLVGPNRVKCEPVGETQIRVVLTGSRQGTMAGDDFADLLPRVKRLIEQPGRLEFRRVHPESRELARRNTCPEGYEVLPQAGAPGRPVQHHVVAREAISGLSSTNLAGVKTTRDPLSGDPRIRISFDAVGAKAFWELTRESIGQQIAVVLDGRLLSAPRVNEPIWAGNCEIAGFDSEDETRLLAAMLAHLLPWKLMVVSVTERAIGSGDETDPVSQQRIAALVQDAKLLYESGKLDEAKTKLDEALKLEPDNEAAQLYLNRVREAQAAKPDVRPPPAPEAGTILDPGRKAIHEQLRRVVLDQVEFPAPGVPLREVVAFLAEAVNVHGTQINFIIAPGLLNATSLVKPSGSAFDNPAEIRVQLSPPLRQVCLADALAAIVQAAEQPLQYTVESYGIVFSPRDPKALYGSIEVMIEAKFVEVSEDASRALGLDWFPDNARVSTNASSVTGTPGSSGGVTTPTGIITDPQFREAVAALRQGGTNDVRELRGDELEWPGRDAPNAANIRVSAALGPSRIGILTEPQLRELLRALEQQPGVDMFSAPKVTTLSGRQAQIQVADLRTVLTGINPAALQEPGLAPGTTKALFTSAAIPVGPTLDLVPQVTADGESIRLNVQATVSEFLGYDTPPPGAQVRVWESGRTRWVDPPLPRFRVRQLAAEALVQEGKTLVLAGAAVADPPKTPDGQAIHNGAVRRKQLLVFVTPRITDPAGNTRPRK